MKVLVNGSREFDDREKLFNFLDAFLRPQDTLISGGARGADQLAEMYAAERGIEIQVFPAQWDLYGRRAGMLRNKQMVNEADMLVSFWDGESKGTKHTIDYAEAKHLPVHVIEYKNTHAEMWERL